MVQMGEGNNKKYKSPSADDPKGTWAKETAKELFNRQSVWTVPNVMSFFRILLVPVMLWLYLGRHSTVGAVIAIAVSAFTDILDGRIARRFDMVSDVGKLLDPVADKLMQAGMLVGLLKTYPCFRWLLCLFAVKEILQFLFGLRMLKRAGEMSSSKWYGKACTVVFYAVMGIFFLFPSIPKEAVAWLSGLTAAMLVLSLVLYIRLYSKLIRESGSTNQETAN